MKFSSRNRIPSRRSARSGALTFALELIIAVVVMAVSLVASPGAAFADGAAATLPTLPTQDSSHVFNVSPGGDIQAAVDAAYNAGGGTVNLAAGRFNITTPIIPRSNVTIQGQGSTGSKLTTLYNALGTDLDVMVNGRSGGLNNAIFQKFKVDCGLSHDQRNQNSNIDKNAGIYLTDTSGSENNQVLLDSVQITRCVMGFHTKGMTNLTIRNSNFHDNGGVLYYTHNAYIRRSSKVNVENSTFSDDYTANGINISYSDNITVQGCTLVNNHFRGVRAANSSYIDILNNTVSGNGDTGIIMNSETAGVTNFRILNNTVTSNSVGISTTSNSSKGSVWNNTVSGNGTDTSIKSSSTSVK